MSSAGGNLAGQPGVGVAGWWLGINTSGQLRAGAVSENADVGVSSASFKGHSR
jgi:hypothetical protein